MSTALHSGETALLRAHVAYFSMEIALRDEVHTYSGGLGVLAGDTARSCADLELPVVFVTLASQDGYLRQEISADGHQIDLPDPWSLERWATPLSAMIAVTIEGREVFIRPWLMSYACGSGKTVPVIFLDTDLEQNAAEDRTISRHLYGDGQSYRLKQEIVLGIGGVRVLQALGLHIRTYHMNEGHSALLALELLREFERPSTDVDEGESIFDAARVREMCVFTTHTPVGAAHDQFDYTLVTRFLGDYMDLAEIKRIGGDDALNMTLLGLNLSGYINGVARRHADITREQFPHHRIHAITNGVHPSMWTHSQFATVYDTNIPHWRHEPELLSRADQLPDELIWEAHTAAKRDLIENIRLRTGVALRAEVPLIGFARRMTGYKRPDLLLTDEARLVDIARKTPFQVVFAGKAHPRDEEGKTLLAEIIAVTRRLGVPTVFVPNYDLALAAKLVAGCDLWLNTPLPPLEASGTSGMKAAFNGVLNASVLDGWWREAWIEGVTGWAIGIEDGNAAEHAHDLYDKLERTILPMYHSDRARWIWMMKQTISKIAPYFNSQRMMRRYAAEAYLR